MTRGELEHARDLRELIAWAFSRRKRREGTAALRDAEGRNAMCSYPCVLSVGRASFACWQRQPGTGLYRRVTAVTWQAARNYYGAPERRLTIGPWQTRGTHDHDHQHNRLHRRTPTRRPTV